MRKMFVPLIFAAFLLGCSTSKPEMMVSQEFIYEIADAKTPQCHASTIAASGNVLIASWFGGTEEKNDDVGIWISRHEGENWSEPREVVNGVQNDTLRYPCWNPVLFQPKEGPLMLFYKVGPSPSTWWGMLVTSTDQGKSWSAPIKLPDGIYGPIKNKPIQLSNGDLLCPTSTEHDGWKVQIERTADLGQTWSNTGDLNDGVAIGAIQPTLYQHPDDVLQMLCRTQNGFISEAWSNDNGQTWSEMKAIDLPNPNSGIDGLTLKDGRHLLVYNPTDGEWGDRVPLTLGLSSDGKSWTDVVEFESLSNPETTKDDEYSYPSIIQTEDDLVHLVYTWNRKTVKHIVINPAGI